MCSDNSDFTEKSGKMSQIFTVVVAILNLFLTCDIERTQQMDQLLLGLFVSKHRTIIVSNSIEDLSLTFRTALTRPLVQS